MSVREGLRVAERADAAGDPAVAVAVVRYLMNNVATLVNEFTNRDDYKKALAKATESSLLQWAIRAIDDAPLSSETYRVDRRGVSCTNVQELQDLSPEDRGAVHVQRFATAVGVALPTSPQ